MIAKESRFNDDGCYRYILTKGNNSELVNRVISSRPYWVQLDPTQVTAFHFKYAQVSR